MSAALPKASDLGRAGPGRLGMGMSREGKVWFRVHKTILWNTAPDLPDRADPDSVVSPSAPLTLPATRAGGQDDVS